MYFWYVVAKNFLFWTESLNSERIFSLKSELSELSLTQVRRLDQPSLQNRSKVELYWVLLGTRVERRLDQGLLGEISAINKLNKQCKFQELYNNRKVHYSEKPRKSFVFAFFLLQCGPGFPHLLPHFTKWIRRELNTDFISRRRGWLRNVLLLTSNSCKI